MVIWWDASAGRGKKFLPSAANAGGPKTATSPLWEVESSGLDWMSFKFISNTEILCSHLILLIHPLEIP
jgi:hypothetical protein